MSGTYVSLFAGIGGLDLAAEALGYRCAGQVEWDESCTRVLERWWPTVPRWGDVHGFTAAAYAERWQLQRRPVGASVAGTSGEGAGQGLQRERRRDPTGDGDPVDSAGHRPEPGRPDLIVGGFPCQPASTAGRRAGTADDRWLWPEFARVVGELRPRFVLVENVPGLLTVNGGRAFSEVLGDLADLGYDATWASVRASDVGAPHRRQRLFLLADAGGSGLQGPRSAEPNGRSEFADGRGLAADAPDAASGDESRIRDTPRLGRRSHGEATADPDRGRREQRHPEQRGVSVPGADGSFAWGPYAATIGRWERVLMRPAPNPVDEKGRLSPAFVEWMMGFPEGWTSEMKRTNALKALGNAVVPQQAILALGALAEMREAA